eukprot:scaffold43350_cov33-Prasinocladus_malaysianus.AAC.3
MKSKMIAHGYQELVIEDPLEVSPVESLETRGMALQGPGIQLPCNCWATADSLGAAAINWEV